MWDNCAVYCVHCGQVHIQDSVNTFSVITTDDVERGAAGSFTILW